jgi:phosphate/sulfate permease
LILIELIASNGVAPMVGVWQTYQTGRAESEFSNATDIILFMVFGAFSQVIGLSTLGHRVMRTIGKDITEVSAPR